MRRVKSLGSALGAGVARNAQVQRQRLHKFRARIGRFRGLRKAGVDTSRLARTGGTAALTYGQATMGVSTFVFLAQRRAVAAAVAPANGGGGQALNLALILADASEKGRSDPAFFAHLEPVVTWANAFLELVATTTVTRAHAFACCHAPICRPQHLG